MRTEETCRTGEDNGHSSPCTGHVGPARHCATQMPSPGAVVSQFVSEFHSLRMPKDALWELSKFVSVPGPGG